ncbi:MAG: mannose-1-phosphate guanylyltransferase, partial [Gloeomargaritaceae cyanobacterium C42_A2020_066]|nr:mannose-1-phosphate guanylyltransferase [Gloeomargaritaceae cyanobacterium C42_A2020_066]
GIVLGDNVTVAAAADLKRPIVLSGVSLGEGAELRGCVVDRNSRVGRRAHILEGAIIGAHCVLGEESQVRPAVAIWPSKAVEAGAIVSTSLIWGQGATRHLFGLRGISGLANIEITPEFAVRLGAAYGSLLNPGAQVVVSRDQRSISRMISRSLMAGLMSTGIHIQDLEATAIPIARYMVGHLAVVGGVHIRLDPERSDHLLIEFLDQRGINLPTAQEKKLETAYLREDLRRATVEGIGDIHTPGMAVAAYGEGFTRHLNGQAIRHSRAKVVIDYAYAVSGAVLPQLLAQLGCDALVLNASLRQNPPTAAERAKLLDQLGRVVTALEATLGIQVGANGEQLVVVDEQGRPAAGDELTALMAALMLRHHPGQTLVVPVTASGAVDQIAQIWGGRVIRTKANPAALMQACQEHRGVILGGSGDMGFIFPQLHPGFDGMFCIAKLIEILTIQEDTLGQVRAQLPQVAYRVERVSCPSRLRGAVLRYLVEHHASRGLDLVDGVRLYPDFPRRDRWVLVLPQPTAPVLDIMVNGPDPTWVNLQVEHYTHLIDTFLHLEITHEIGVDQ